MASTEDNGLVDQVRTLRAMGRSPKEIARATGARPARVTAIVRELGREAFHAEGEGALVGAWISPGWRTGLAGADRPDWVDLEDERGMDGLVSVLVARRHRPQRLSVCGYLVDVYCLGVKNALGPEVLTDRDLPAFQDAFFTGFLPEKPLDAPLDLARHLVHGAVDYARTLGFEPHPDFALAADHLGGWDERSAITFGRDGVPTFVSGPHDNPRAAIRTLNRTVGEGKFHYITHV